MAILLGEGDKLQCIFVVVVEISLKLFTLLQVLLSLLQRNA